MTRKLSPLHAFLAPLVAASFPPPPARAEPLRVEIEPTPPNEPDPPLDQELYAQAVTAGHRPSLWDDPRAVSWLMQNTRSRSLIPTKKGTRSKAEKQARRNKRKQQKRNRR